MLKLTKLKKFFADQRIENDNSVSLREGYTRGFFDIYTQVILDHLNISKI